MAEEQQDTNPVITHVRLFEAKPQDGQYRTTGETREEWLVQEEKSGYVFDNEVWVGETMVRVTTIPRDAWLASQRAFNQRYGA